MAIISALGLLFLLQGEAIPDSERGLYAIWATPEVSNPLPFIKGDQVRLQWSAVEPREGHYDFSDLHRQLERVAKLGRATTVQLNANRHPQFLFGKAPYNKKALSKAEQDGYGSLQYWHPAYVKAYTELLAAFAREVKSSPHRARVIGVRLNYNAIGTEFMIVRPEDQDPANWIVPPGVTSAPRWTEEIATAYRRTVVDAFIRNFSPDIRVFLRSGVSLYPHPDPETQRLGGPGNLGVFTTGSEIEPRSPNIFERYTTVFLAYCRTGKAVCYAESIADATGRHGGQKDPRWCSPEQYNYWRLLSDLNLGFSMIGVYGSDLENADNPEYRAAFEFASRYAGYHASPSVSPGAWVALRESSLLLKGDYTFLMRRLPGGETRAEQKIGPDDQRFGAWARTLPKGAQAKFALDPEFARSLAGKKATIRVVYLDRGQGSFWINISGRKFQRELSASDRWKTGEFEIDRASFAAGGAHVVLDGDTDVTLHMVEVARLRN